jgi:molybdate-binding protein
MVHRGEADVGLGLRASATALDLDFVQLGSEPVEVLASPDRQSKPGVQSLAAALEELESILADLDGYGP